MKKYIITILAVSWGLTGLIFLNPKTAINNFGLIMFIPLIMTIIFHKIEEKKTGMKEKILKKRFNRKAMLFGCLYPIVFVMICAGIAVMLGQGTVVLDKEPVAWIIRLLVTVLIGLFSALGEEYGWRGYLLPKLTNIYGKKKAVLLTGAVWSLYHIPVVYLLAKLTGLGNPLLICVIQAAVVFVSNFAFSFCYYLSDSIIPVIFYHSIWNTWNTAILGDIYTGKQGIVHGNIFIVNGEGVIGLIVAVVIVIYFWKKIDNHKVRKMA